jgi:hypothetical protein
MKTYLKAIELNRTDTLRIGWATTESWEKSKVKGETINVTVIMVIGNETSVPIWI